MTLKTLDYIPSIYSDLRVLRICRFVDLWMINWGVRPTEERSQIDPHETDLDLAEQGLKIDYDGGSDGGKEAHRFSISRLRIDLYSRATWTIYSTVHPPSYDYEGTPF